MKEIIKTGDWVVHNYMGSQSLEIFRVGKIVNNDKVYNDYNGCITQYNDWVYLDNCTKLTPEQCVSMGVFKISQ